MNCRVLILNYNGQAHLEACLPSVLEAASLVKGGCPVAVVDNCSTDDSVKWLRTHHPHLERVACSRNDCLFSLNDIVASLEEDCIVILNNDMHFEKNFITAMLPHFKDPSVFAVTARVMDWDGNRLTTGQRIGKIKYAWFYKSWRPEVDHSCLTLDAGGGCAMFRRTMFIELGGFDRLYSPAYWEDTDLSYRAWRRGWKVIYEPSSVIYHRVGATLDEMAGGRPAVTRLIRRNEILFALRNVGGWGFVAGFLVILPLRMLRNALAKNHAMWLGALRALPRAPAALKRRWCDGQSPKRNDADFLNEIDQSTFSLDTKRSEASPR